MPAAADTALIAVNLGTPDAPTAAAVRRYLGEFLSDPRVVSIPPLLWKPLLHGLILPLRGPRSAANYAKVWTEEGSPLLVHTHHLAQGLQQCLPQWRVLAAMRYGAPSLRTALRELRVDGVRKLVVLPLYPQYSTTTTASVADLVAEETAGMDVTLIEDYSSDAAWVAAVAASIRRYRHRHGGGRHLLFSFHGLPQRIANAGDPYPQRCQDSASAVAAALGLDAGQWSLSYQSGSAANAGWSRPPCRSWTAWPPPGCARWTWSAPGSRSIAWRPWRRWRWAWPSTSRPRAGGWPTFPA